MTSSTDTSTAHKIRENRLRRMAQRQGLMLQKARRRDPCAYDYGTYCLADPRTGTLVAGDINTGYGLGLDDVERELTRDARDAQSYRLLQARQLLTEAGF